MFLRKSGSKDSSTKGGFRPLFGRSNSADHQDGRPKPSILRAFGFGKGDGDKTPRRHSGSDIKGQGFVLKDLSLLRSKPDLGKTLTAEEVKYKEVYLQFALRMRTPDMRWEIVTLKLEANGDDRSAVVLQNSVEVERLPLSVTSFILETKIAPLSFAIVTEGRIVHFQAPKDVVVVVWLDHFRRFVRESSPYPEDPFYREALLRQTGESYDVKFLVKQKLGVMFDYVDALLFRPQGGKASRQREQGLNAQRDDVAPGHGHGTQLRRAPLVQTDLMLQLRHHQRIPRG